MNAQYTFINSADRLQGNSTDFLIDLSDIDLSAQRHGIQIQNFILPNNYYNINSYNNVINLGITDGSITIPQGNYSSTEFINYFNTNNCWKEKLGLKGIFVGNLHRDACRESSVPVPAVQRRIN